MAVVQTASAVLSLSMLAGASGSPARSRVSLRTGDRFEVTLSTSIPCPDGVRPRATDPASPVPPRLPLSHVDDDADDELSPTPPTTTPSKRSLLANVVLWLLLLMLALAAAFLALCGLEAWRHVESSDTNELLSHTLTIAQRTLHTMFDVQDCTGCGPRAY
jgi:hypothetical protein